LLNPRGSKPKAGRKLSETETRISIKIGTKKRIKTRTKRMMTKRKSTKHRREIGSPISGVTANTVLIEPMR